VVVFLLNVLAFLFVGLQARAVMRDLATAELRHALGFSLTVLAVVILVRIVFVLAYNRAIQPVYRRLGYGPGPTIKQGIVASWCGMRGMVTLAAALALPVSFPERGLIVICALTVVLGTLVIQGLTLEPLVRLLRFPSDTSREDELAHARSVLDGVAEKTFAGNEGTGGSSTHIDAKRIADLRLAAASGQREALQTLRWEGRIDEDTFRVLEQEIDLDEVSATRDRPFNLIDT
jgi:CPA1 family monovalent cation:H+ antiporter